MKLLAFLNLNYWTGLDKALALSLALHVIVISGISPFLKSSADLPKKPDVIKVQFIELNSKKRDEIKAKPLVEKKLRQVAKSTPLEPKAIKSQPVLVEASSNTVPDIQPKTVARPKNNPNPLRNVSPKFPRNKQLEPVKLDRAKPVQMDPMIETTIPDADPIKVRANQQPIKHDNQPKAIEENFRAFKIQTALLTPTTRSKTITNSDSSNAGSIKPRAVNKTAESISSKPLSHDLKAPINEVSSMEGNSISLNHTVSRGTIKTRAISRLNDTKGINPVSLKSRNFLRASKPAQEKNIRVASLNLSKHPQRKPLIKGKDSPVAQDIETHQTISDSLKPKKVKPASFALNPPTQVFPKPNSNISAPVSPKNVDRLKKFPLRASAHQVVTVAPSQTEATISSKPKPVSQFNKDQKPLTHIKPVKPLGHPKVFKRIGSSIAPSHQIAKPQKVRPHTAKNINPVKPVQFAHHVTSIQSANVFNGDTIGNPLKTKNKEAVSREKVLAAIEPIPSAPLRKTNFNPEKSKHALSASLGRSNPSPSRKNNISEGEKRAVHQQFTHEVRSRIAKTQYFPKRARERGWEGNPVLKFTLDKKGNLLNYVLAKSSSYPILDEAAIETLKEAAPFPEIPEILQLDTIKFKLPISYILEKQ